MLCLKGFAMTSRILFVCLGNICRSPAAQGVFRMLAPHVPCDSAGTGGWHLGEAPYLPMQVAARARGFDISDLRARQFGVQDFTSFDLILAMDGQNLQEIERLRPAQCPTTVRLFTDYAPEHGMDHIPDPYYTQDFDGALDLIEACARGLADRL